MHGRPIVLDGELEEYRHEADFVKHRKHRVDEPADLYQPYDYSKGHKWAMAIDLAACVGCGVCTAACQAENNIPVVGREECSHGREMHWIRVDRYHEGDPDNPTVRQQPMACQHCDNAPCENVCPVNATAHSPEGLNEMTYNRCVGTRYCANNCPYKVRRFNFLRYQDAQLRDSVQELAFNPQVTVRGVGVMEKCTFCVQRINAAKFKAQNADRPVADGDVRPACQQACPAQAIVFGDVNDPQSRIAEQRGSARAFHVLDELNVRPNITYLARVRNSNDQVRAERVSPQEDHEG
jgi:molybdopterin-containing oxidoreductase family iron-sulfur binding subunit